MDSGISYLELDTVPDAMHGNHVNGATVALRLEGGQAVGDKLARDRPIAIAPGFRLQWEEAQDAHVLLYPEGMVRLGSSAGAILSRCDGERTLTDVLDSLKEAFPGADLEADVVEFLEIALDKGWIALSRH